MNIYLDINGVVLHQGKPARHLTAFLQYVTSAHTAWWLSSYTRDHGDPRPYLQASLPADAWQYAQNVRTQHWDHHKTDGIDFTQPFRWLDDSPAAYDLAILAQREAGECLLTINLDHRPDQLRTIAALI